MFWMRNKEIVFGYTLLSGGLHAGRYSFSCCDSSINGSLFYVHQKTFHISSVNVVRCKSANVKIYEQYGTILLLFHNQHVVGCCH